jgi:hypothetical protein
MVLTILGLVDTGIVHLLRIPSNPRWFLEQPVS